MKKHDEDLWDFRSDFEKKKAEYDFQDQQSDSYRNILKSASDTSSLDDIDNMTFVMKDGQASFVETPAAKEESHNSKQTTPEKEDSPEENTASPEEVFKDIELFKTPVAASKKEEPAPEVTAPESCEEEETVIPNTEETTSSDTTEDVSAQEEVAEEVSKEETETKPEEQTEVECTEEVTTLPASVIADAPAEEAPVIEDAPVEEIIEETPDGEKAETKEQTEDTTKENNSSEKEETPAENTNKFDGEIAIPKDIIEGTPKKKSSNSQRKAPATDDDFILAKPHSKKRSRSHSHSHGYGHQHTVKDDEDLPIDSVEDYVFAHYHKDGEHHTHHHHHHHSHSHSAEKSDYTHNKENEDTTVVRSTTSSPLKSKKKDSKKARKWKSRPWWQKLLIILAWASGILAVLLIIAIILFLIFSRIGIKEATNYDGATIVPPSFVEVEENGTVQIYKGKKYVLNTNIANILCIGVDKSNINSTPITYDEYSNLSENGQADALFLIALDTETGKTTVLSIPRDTMADINIYNKNGDWLKTDTLQICQSYAYGDGQESSCKNTIDAVQKLFYQLPIQTYFAMDLSAIAPLNDTVGGIKVTLKEDFYDSNNDRHPKGKTMVLYGDHARKYLQYRDTNKDASSIDRLQRQTSYLKSFTTKALYLTKKDITTPITLYNIASENSISNMDVYKLSGFARCLMENGVTKLEFKTIPGTSSKSETVDENGNKYNEYHIDEEKFYELFLETFFVPVN